MAVFNLNILERLKNKTFLLTFAATLIAFIYQVCSLFEIVPPISQDETVNLVTLIVTILANVGVLIDPTTDGVSDSELVMNRGKKKGDE